MIARTATTLPIELLVKGRPSHAAAAAEAAIGEQDVGGDDHGGGVGTLGDPVVRRVKALFSSTALNN